MENINNKNKDTKKIFTLIVLIATLMICETGATYAWFALSASNNNVVSGTAATATLNLTTTVPSAFTTKFNSSTNVMVPQVDAALGTAINTTNYCVDGNSNIVCKVFQITIKNNSTARVELKGDITFSGLSSLTNLYWKPLTNANTINTTTYGTSFYFKAANTDTAALTSGSVNSRLITSSLKLAPANASTCTTAVPTSTTTSDNPGTCVATYFIVVWIHETNAAQTESGTWYATVKFTSSNGTGVTSTITA